MKELEDRWRELGEYIREQRMVGQISLRKLSEMAGVSNPYLSQIERGLRKPSAEILQQIAKALSLSAETLYIRAGILDEDSLAEGRVVMHRLGIYVRQSHVTSCVASDRSLRHMSRGGFGKVTLSLAHWQMEGEVMAQQKKDAKPKGEEGVLATIAEMPEAERVIAERLHAIIRESVPELTPRLWYGQPAYAKNGKVICFFRGAEIDKERYLTFGFSGDANLDDGNMWPTAYALTGLSAADESRIKDLVVKAAR